MDMIAQVLLGIGLVDLIGLIGCIWALICNNKTHEEIDVLIDQAYERKMRGDVTAKWPGEIMSYDRHFWLKMTFRDAMSRYDRAGHFLLC